MSQVESMRGAKILTPAPRGIENLAAVYDSCQPAISFPKML
jgi:hypothetical protein